MSVENRKNIAVVDSDEDFARTLVELLDVYGFDAAAVTRDEIEQYIQDNPVDLVTTDLRGIDDTDRLDISGLILAKKLANKPVIILSAASQLPEGKIVPENARFLGKFESSQTLVATIREMTDQPQK